MKKTVILIAAILVFFGLIIGAGIAYNKLSNEYEPPSNTAESSEPERSPAPDFTAYDREGNPVSLSDFKGKPVVVNFWASWCGPCRMEMPEFEEAYQEYGEDIVFMMVNMTDGRRETQSSAESLAKNFTFPVYFDHDTGAASAYNVMSLPATYFIDREGRIAAHANGMIEKTDIAYGISLINE